MKPIYQQTNLIAHRGLSGNYFENTLPAFLHACKSEFWGIETDVQFTKDHKLVCFHDKSTKRILGLKDTLSNLKLKSIKRLGIVNNGQNKVCKFSTYLRLCRKYKKHCVIELKYKMTKGQILKVLKSIKFHRCLNNSTIISFNKQALEYIRSVNSTIKLQLLIQNPIKRYVTFCQKHHIDVSIHCSLVTKDIVTKLHEHGIKVGVWTINNLSSAQKYVNYGIDYITSNHLI